MGKRFLIDTNILIYYLDGLIPQAAEGIVDEIFRSSFNISVITKIEFLGWRNFSETQLKKAAGLLSGARILGLDENVAEEAIKIRRRKRVRLPDAVIAATCLANGFTLVTRNADDFIGIEGIDIYNPFPDA